MSLEDKLSSATIARPMSEEEEELYLAHTYPFDDLDSDMASASGDVKTTMLHVFFGIQDPSTQEAISQKRKEIYGIEEQPSSYGKKSILASILVTGGASLAFPFLVPYAIAEVVHYLTLEGREKPQAPCAPLVLHSIYALISKVKMTLESPAYSPSYRFPSKEEKEEKERKESFF